MSLGTCETIPVDLVAGLVLVQPLTEIGDSGSPKTKKTGRKGGGNVMCTISSGKCCGDNIQALRQEELVCVHCMSSGRLCSSLLMF